MSIISIGMRFLSCSIELEGAVFVDSLFHKQKGKNMIKTGYGCLFFLLPLEFLLILV